MEEPHLDQATVLQAVQRWSDEDRMAFLRAFFQQEVARSHDSNHINELTRLVSELRFWEKLALTKTQTFEPPKVLSSAIHGVAATDQPPPTDEEVERILEEERWKKYGM